MTVRDRRAVGGSFGEGKTEFGVHLRNSLLSHLGVLKESAIGFETVKIIRRGGGED